MDQAFISCVLILIGLTVSSDAWCVRYKADPKDSYNIFVCRKSSDHKSDLQKITTTNITDVGFIASHVPILKNDDFTSVPHLSVLVVASSELAEIENLAFKPLTNLSVLVIAKNELTTIKAAWLKHSPHLKHIVFADNRIQTIEPEVSEIIGNLEHLRVFDISYNQLHVLPPNFLDNADIGMFIYSENPWSFKQLWEIIRWGTLNEKIRTPETYIQYVYNTTETCIGDPKFASEKSEEEVHNCVTNALSEEVEKYFN